MRILLLVCVVMAGMAPAGALCQEDDGSVDFAILSAANLKELLPEEKLIGAVAGDLFLRNKQLIAVIAKPVAGRHASPTVKEIGGGLIDFALREQPRDHLVAYRPGPGSLAYRRWKLIDSTGNTLEPTTTLQSTAEGVQVQLQADAAAGQPSAEITYYLDPGEPFIAVVNSIKNDTDQDIMVNPADELNFGSVTPETEWSPDGAGSLFWLSDLDWGQAYGVSLISGTSRFSTKSGRTLLDHTQTDGQDATGVKIAARSELKQNRWLFVGSDLLDLRASVSGLVSDDLEPVTFQFKSAGQPVVGAVARVLKDGTYYGRSTTNAEGLVPTLLAPGKYTVELSINGKAVATPRPLTAKIFRTAGGTVRFNIPATSP